MAPTQRTLIRRLVALACLVALVGAAACSDDTTSSRASDELSASFCEAKAALDGVSPDTPDVAALRRYQHEAIPFLDRLAAEAPGELEDAVAALRDSISQPETLEEAGAAASDERIADAKEEIGLAVHDMCDFEQVKFVVVDHAFEAAPQAVARGEVSVLLDNRGEALHALIVFRVHDDVPEADVPDLISSGEFETRADFVNAMPAAGGHQAQLVINLEAGRYVYFDDEHIGDMQGTFTVT